MKITNTQKGPRGVNAVSGPVLIEPNETVEIDVYAREKDHLEASRWFEIEGSYKDDPEAAAAPTQVTLTNSDGKDGVYIPASEFNAMRQGFEQQASDISTLRGENDDLKRQLAERDADLAKLRSVSGGASSAYTVKETSPGWFGIFEGEKQIGKNMREGDAEAFKGMSPEEQKAYLAE
ncbi:hypothetical protein AB3480_00490 [Rhizobium mongolense]|uniref:hypothetical protein n=1 Tax=Rhizobium mongolense TaxID=57676 RepID=UPI0034A0F6C3